MKNKHKPKKIKEYVTKLNWFTKKYDPSTFTFLGAGSFGAVFESRRLKDKQIVALKYIETCSYSEYEKTFDEVKTLKKLSHPNILKIYDECFMTEPLDDDNDEEEDEKNEEDNKNLYKLIIVSERGLMSLKQYIEQKSILKENEILQIFSDLVQALIFSKEKKIFHCDIKPENILVFEGDRETNVDLQKLFVHDPKLVFKLCDWGGASNLERAGTMTRIKSEEIGCSKPYASPEIIDAMEDKDPITSKKFDLFKCDIFSLAITVLVLCGVPVKTLLNMSRADSYPIDLKKIFEKFIHNNYPKFLADLLYKMLTFENEKRLNIQEVSEILKENSSLPSPQKKNMLAKSQIKTMDDEAYEEEITFEKKILSKGTFSDKYPLKMDPSWENFVEKLMKGNEIASLIVKNAMLRVNRKNFVLNEKEALDDTPKLIGWATTISQPTMQALTLNLLCPFLVNAKKALDIGTGSGYISACMAEIMGPKGVVYSVDHIADILGYAKKCVEKGNKYLLDHIKFHECDGREGLEKYGPYDVIHIGGAVTDMPTEIISQLVEGGVIFAPVGTDSQRIFIWEKEKNGHLKMEGKLQVQYGPLMSKEEHLKRIQAYQK